MGISNHDSTARKLIAKAPKSIYFWIVAASYVYYHRPEYPFLLSDVYFDRLCKHLLDNRAEIGEHSHLGELVTNSHLTAGTLYDILAMNYPLWLVRMAEDLVNELEDKV